MTKEERKIKKFNELLRYFGYEYTGDIFIENIQLKRKMRRLEDRIADIKISTLGHDVISDCDYIDKINSKLDDRLRMDRKIQELEDINRSLSMQLILKNNNCNSQILNKDEFYNTYCTSCGSQRCSGLDDDFSVGCKYKKEFLKKGE